MLSVEPKTVVELAAIVLLVAALTALQRRYRFLQYLFFLRLPLVHALILLVLPVAVWTRAFRNLFVVTPMQLAAVALLLVFSTWAVTYAWGLLFIGAAPRFRLKFRQPDLREIADWDRNPLPNKVLALLATERRRVYVVPLILGTPVLVFCARYSTSQPWEKALAIAGGLGIAFGLRELSLWVGQRFRRWLYTPQTAVPATRFFHLRRRIHEAAYRISETMIGRALRPAFSAGYSSLSSDDPASTATPLEESENTFSHWRWICFAALALVVYVVGAFVLNPSHTNPFVEHTPALAYVLLIVTLLGLVLPATTFLLDLYRVPLVVLLAIALFMSYRFSDLDHYYDFSIDAYAAGARLPAPLTASEVVANWNEKHSASEYPVMVVIAASGGGSHAARWTTEVLSRLRGDERLGARFFTATSFVTAVSGGALGTMYALEAFKNGPPTHIALERANEAAGHSNVGALAWGVTYPDLVRKIFPWMFDERRDRGWALEQAWRSVLAEPSRVATLASWTQEARLGTKPAVVFNATVMETGKRFLLSRVVIPKTGADQFAEQYKDRDLSVVTAVRLSAAFPYLSPIARPYGSRDKASEKFDESAYHVADGGYYDGSGTMTAVEFLREVLLQYRTLGRRKILLVEIRTALENSEPPAAGHKNWLAGLAGPVSTAYHVSLSSQASRAALELQLLADRWDNDDLPEAMRVQIKPVVFRLRGTGTLPWHLSADEKTAIADEWMTRENQQALTQLVDFFAVSP